jgi:hypothetical protein
MRWYRKRLARRWGTTWKSTGAYGTRLSYLLGPPAEFSPSGGGGLKGETVGGTMVVYEESLLSGQLGIEPATRELVIVRNLRTGRIVHRVPTGTSVVPIPRFVGIGLQWRSS